MEPKLIPLEIVRLRLLLPDSEIPLSSRNTDRILERLGMEPVMAKIKEQGQPRKHVTKDQAAEIEQEFRRTHWKKFKAAEAKN